MSHVDPELLAGDALGEQDALTHGDRQHLVDCPECRAELAELHAVVTAAADRDAAQLSVPGPQVWGRIQAELARPAAGAGAAADEPGAPLRLAQETPATGSGSEITGPGREIAGSRSASAGFGNGVAPVNELATRGRRPNWALVLAAAALGLIVGIGGALAVRSRAEAVEVLWATQLAPLSGQTGSGTADVVRTSDGTKQLRVKIAGAPTGSDYHEVWLAQPDLARMISVGNLPASGQGTFDIPPTLQPKLNGYTVVDISLEPNDGNPLHSATSVLRGTLPQ